MPTTYEVLPEEVNASTAEAGFVTAAKSQFTTFFQSKGFSCAADALQQLKATCNKQTVRFSVSDPKIASDQGHAVCYLSFAPFNKSYKIAIGNIAQAASADKAYTYTLVEDSFAKSNSFQQKLHTFYSLEELLNTVFPKATSLSGNFKLQSLFSFLF